MTRDCKSVSFVAVFSRILPMIPALDNQFCRDLFGKPYKTINGMTPEGYVIAIENKPLPSITISPQKIVFKAKTAEELSKYVESLKDKFLSINLPIDYSAFGVNFEYQWMDLPEDPSLWMRNCFIKDNISIEGTTCFCNHVALRFILNETEALNIEIMPRNGIRNGILASINHHHAIGGKAFPKQSDLEQMFAASTELLEQIIFNHIISN